MLSLYQIQSLCLPPSTQHTLHSLLKDTLAQVQNLGLLAAKQAINPQHSGKALRAIQQQTA